MYSSRYLFPFLLWFIVLLPTQSVEASAREFTLPFERVTVAISMDDSVWEIGYEKVLTGFSLIEWVPRGETAEQWSFQFRAMRMSRAMTKGKDASTLAKRFVSSLADRCDNDATQYEVLESNATSALISWRLKNCQSGHPFSFDQVELTRFIVGDEYTFNLAFTRNLGQGVHHEKEQSMFDENVLLAALRSAVIRESVASGTMAGMDVELMKIPLYQVYAQFDDPDKEFGQIWFEETGRKGTGRSLEMEYRLGFEGLPPDHWYAVYIIKSPEGLALPVQYGLKPGEDTELVCPADMAGITPVESVTGQKFEESSWPTAFPCADLPGRRINDTLSFGIGDFQAGLAAGVAVQSHDGSHRYLATVVPRPLRGSDANCTIELELASPDGKTYLLRGEGFESKEILSGSWKYAKNISELDIPVNSDGSFTIPLFHSGEAKGRKKWRAEIHAAGSNCAPGIEYFWGKDGMKK